MDHDAVPIDDRRSGFFENETWTIERLKVFHRAQLSRISEAPPPVARMATDGHEAVRESSYGWGPPVSAPGIALIAGERSPGSAASFSIAPCARFLLRDFHTYATTRSQRSNDWD